MQTPARLSGSFHVTPSRGTSSGPEVFRVLDWTNIDAPPTSMDVARLVSLGGSARVAILVNTPRMLRAANTFSEQAGLHGVQVRVFIDSAEALAWLYKPLPQGMPKA
jgi:hypothetical protein